MSSLPRAQLSPQDPILPTFRFPLGHWHLHHSPRRSSSQGCSNVAGGRRTASSRMGLGRRERGARLKELGPKLGTHGGCPPSQHETTLSQKTNLCSNIRTKTPLPKIEASVSPSFIEQYFDSTKRRTCAQRRVCAWPCSMPRILTLRTKPLPLNGEESLGPGDLRYKVLTAVAGKAGGAAGAPCH